VPDHLFVARDFDAFVAARGEAYADPVLFRRADGKLAVYHRLTPGLYAWLYGRLNRVRDAVAAGTLDAAKLALAERRFALVARWAARHVPPEALDHALP
jgi:hypothetical protein